MWQLGINPIELVVRSAIVYALFLVALRISGKREIGQFTLFDLALVLLAANALQPAITGADQSLTGGAIILATLFSLNRLVAELRIRVPFVRRLLDSPPTVIGRDGRWIKAEFARQDLEIEDAEEALRQHGLEDVRQMKKAILEKDGSINIIPVDGGSPANAMRRRRHVRRSRL